MYQQLAASYRDRSGFVLEYRQQLYRQIQQSYRQHYEKLMTSGLYEQLTSEKLLLQHVEIKENYTGDTEWYLTLQPEFIKFISYPYEWCFSQLKDAALLTLSIMQQSLEKGMILKDATPYNVQFRHGKPVFIDTLSFEIYDDTKPWIAYYQFCETFLYPLLIAHYGVQEVHHTFTAYPDGIPVAQTVAMLPGKCKFNLFNYLHVYLLLKIKNKRKSSSQKVQFSATKLRNLLVHLQSKIAGLEPPKQKTTWNNYYAETILSEEYLKAKAGILQKWAEQQTNSTVLDLGCNDGYFSLLFSKVGHQLISTDFDAACINHFYIQIQKLQISNIHPLCIDIMLPSTNQGFFNLERKGFFERVKADLILMLAVVHHLVISKNMTLAGIAKNMAGLAPQLIIEFIPKTDSKVQELLANKEDVFWDYSESHFESAFGVYYTLQQKTPIAPTGRILYFYTKKGE